MSSYKTKSVLHVRIRNFVTWIAPSKETRQTIKDKSDEVRNNIKAEAEKDGLTITQMPYSGSFQTKTGLRRHMRGLTTTEGQDVDIPFVVKPDKETEFEPLIKRFKKYAEDSYPGHEIKETKSSVNIVFPDEKLTFDIVPMFETSISDQQKLIRNTGEVIITSIEKHKDFIKSRTAETNESDGIVTFNNTIRLLKWWNKAYEAESGEDSNLFSFLINLLGAKAYKVCGDEMTYPQTMANWFSYLADLIRSRETIWFNDYYKVPSIDTTKPWNVLDPVMADNNITKNWAGYEVDELADRFQAAAEIMNRAIVADLQGRDADSLRHLQLLFGKIFSSHCN